MKMLLLPTLLICAQPALAATDKADPTVSTTHVAVIRMQDAIKGTKDGLKAEETLRKEFEAKKKGLDAEQTKIQKEMDDLRKQAMVMDEKTRADKEQAIQKEVQAFEESKMRAQQDV